MKRTGAGVLRKRPADPEPERKPDQVQISLAVRRIQESAVIEYVVPTEYVLHCSDDDRAGDFGDDIIFDW